MLAYQRSCPRLHLLLPSSYIIKHHQLPQSRETTTVNITRCSYCRAHYCLLPLFEGALTSFSIKNFAVPLPSQFHIFLAVAASSLFSHPHSLTYLQPFSHFGHFSPSPPVPPNLIWSSNTLSSSPLFILKLSLVLNLNYSSTTHSSPTAWILERYQHIQRSLNHENCIAKTRAFRSKDLTASPSLHPSCGKGTIQVRVFCSPLFHKSSSETDSPFKQYNPQPHSTSKSVI
jgi:hypothetical protein